MNKPIYKQWWFYVIIAIILIAGGVALYFTVFKDNKSEVKETSTKVESNAKDTEDKGEDNKEQNEENSDSKEKEEVKESKEDKTDNESNGSSNEEESISTEDKEASSGEESGNKKKFNEENQVGIFNVKVNGTRTIAHDPKDLFSPAEGYEYLLVDTTIKNTGDETRTVSTLTMMSIVDKDGERCKEANAKCTKKTAQLDVTLAPGEEANGEFVAEVPVGSTDLYFVFYSSAMGGEKSIVKLR